MIENNVKKETLYLYLIQVSNFLIPLLTFPYLAAKLGVESFGKIGFATTLFFLFTFIVDFGFILSGAKSISLNKESNDISDVIYTNIQFSKTIIFTLLLVISSVIIFFIDINKLDFYIIFLCLLFSFTSILTPAYLFNGLGKNSVLAAVTVIVRLLFVIPIFFLVDDAGDIWYAIFLQLLPYVIIGLLIQSIIRKNRIINFKFSLINKEIAIKESRESFENFIASFFTLGFTYLTPLVVKGVFGDYALGLYTLIERLISALRQMYVPINQSFFSKVCVIYEYEDKREYVAYIKLIFKIFISIGFLVILLNNLIGEYILGYLFPKYEIFNLLNLAIITQLFISIASILVNFVIIPSGNSRFLKYVYMLASIIYIPLIFTLILCFEFLGVFLSMLIIEIFILILLFSVAYFKVYGNFKGGFDND